MAITKSVKKTDKCPRCGGPMSPLKSIPPKSSCRRCNITVVTGKSPRPAIREFRLLVCGSRDWQDEESIYNNVTKLLEEQGVQRDQVLIITGSVFEDDNGADSIIEAMCREDLGIACAAIRAPWKFYDKKASKRSAGPIRNGWMLKWGRPDFILAFHPYLPNSRGTKNMCEQARKQGIPVRVIER